jgi:diadenosine tetraphosphate (Ap4A) HIT family hydrolase
MTPEPDGGFALDPRLAHDTVFVADWPLCRVLLMDDARFPWLVLVPRRAGLVELVDLDAADLARLMHEIRRALHALRRVVDCDKLNVGALGNIVRQLHVHVVARRRDDAAWPGPVWGHGPAQPHAPAARDARVAALREATRDHAEDRVDVRRGPRDG